MSRNGYFQSAVCRSRNVLCRIVGGSLLLAQIAPAAESDWLRTDAPGSAPALSEKGSRQADAMAYFMTGLFQEENAGPDKALESKRNALNLDPGCTDLAIEVSGEYLRRGDTTQAITVLKDAIAAAPKMITPYLALSTIYLRQLQKPALAVKYAQQAVETAPQDFSGYELLWDIYQSQGESTKAVQLLERASRSKSTDPGFWLSLAAIYLQTDGLAPDAGDKAGRYLEEAALQAGNKYEVLSKIGDLYVQAKEMDKAIPFYRRILEAKPTFPRVREKLATCYIATDQVDPAIEQVEELVHVNPLNLAGYDQLTQLYLKKGELTKAVANARQALLIDPTRIERHMLVVELYSRLHQMNDVANTLAEARRQFPDTARLTHLYGVALSQAGRHDEAMRAFEQAIVEAPRSQPDELNSMFYFDYGAAAEQAGQYARAEENFRKCIAMDPENSAKASNYLGYMWVDRGERLDEAAKLIHQALVAEPNNGAYLDSLGWLYFKQGKYDDSLATLLRAGELLPEPDPVVFEHIADAYYQLGKKAEAVLYWQKSLQLDPGNKRIIANLDQVSDKVAEQPINQADARK